MLVIAFSIGWSRPAFCLDEFGLQAGFEEHLVEFHNQNVKLAGSLLLPKMASPLPAVIFVHGAGPQTREQYRKHAEYFVRQGIAVLIYDKRGTGQSEGAYESRKPYDNLVNDALAGVDFLRQRSEIAASQIGMWGLSQGGSICAAAAAQSQDVQFIVTVGAEVADGMLYFYRDNLFRKYGLSARLRDVAEKTQLAADTLLINLQDESVFSTFAPKKYPKVDEYVHPAWSRVDQPVLAMWGRLDQHVPVGESIVGLKNSLAKANNQRWTIVILPWANHDLKVSETGELHVHSSDFAKDALKTMTDWIHGVIDNPARIAIMKQKGSAAPTGVLSKLVRYEKLRWYGNGTVQAALLLLFLCSFFVNTIEGLRYVWFRLLHFQTKDTLNESSKLQNFRRIVCALNLLILIAMQVTLLLVFDPIHPICPTVLTFTPLLGSVSVLATITLIIKVVRTHRGEIGGTLRRYRTWFDYVCLALFVPYMFYWNLIGYRF